MRGTVLETSLESTHIILIFLWCQYIIIPIIKEATKLVCPQPQASNGSARIKHRSVSIQNSCSFTKCANHSCVRSVWREVICQNAVVVWEEAHWMKPPTWSGTIMTICVNYFTTGGPGKEHGTNKSPPTGKTQERSKGDTTSHLPEFSVASILAEQCVHHLEGPLSQNDWPKQPGN